jgi:hypothetical protein
MRLSLPSARTGCPQLGQLAACGLIRKPQAAQLINWMGRCWIGIGDGSGSAGWGGEARIVSMFASVGGGTKRIVSKPQWGQTILSLSLERVTASNWMCPLQFWQGQVTTFGALMVICSGHAQLKKRHEPNAAGRRHREAPWTEIRQAAPVWGVGLPALSGVVIKFAVSCPTFRLR